MLTILVWVPPQSKSETRTGVQGVYFRGGPGSKHEGMERMSQERRKVISRRKKRQSLCSTEVFIAVKKLGHNLVGDPLRKHVESSSEVSLWKTGDWAFIPWLWFVIVSRDVNSFVLKSCWASSQNFRENPEAENLRELLEVQLGLQVGRGDLTWGTSRVYYKDDISRGAGICWILEIFLRHPRGET